MIATTEKLVSELTFAIQQAGKKFDYSTQMCHACHCRSGFGLGLG